MCVCVYVCVCVCAVDLLSARNKNQRKYIDKEQ